MKILIIVLYVLFLLMFIELAIIGFYVTFKTFFEFVVYPFVNYLKKTNEKINYVKSKLMKHKWNYNIQDHGAILTCRKCHKVKGMSYADAKEEMKRDRNFMTYPLQEKCSNFYYFWRK